RKNDSHASTHSEAMGGSGVSLLQEVVAVAWGSFTHQQTLRSLRMFIEEVMPALTGRSVPVA
ncbi:MAG: hypothetical protein ACE1ZZ_03325, partial [Dehalococcoidia bacterium]